MRAGEAASNDEPKIALTMKDETRINSNNNKNNKNCTSGRIEKKNSNSPKNANNSRKITIDG